MDRDRASVSWFAHGHALVLECSLCGPVGVTTLDTTRGFNTQVREAILGHCRRAHTRVRT